MSATPDRLNAPSFLRQCFGLLAIALPLSCGGCHGPSDSALLKAAIEAAASGESAEINIQSHRDIHDSDLAGLENLTGLERLRLDESMITDAAMDYIKPLKQLQSLSLSKTRVTDAGLAELRGFDSLEMLWLDCTQISDESLRTVASLPKLQSLSLYKDYITDKGLIDLGKMSQLRTLSLDETQITDAGLKHLRSLTGLDYLSVWRTRVTDEGVGELRKALPNLRVNR